MTFNKNRYCCLFSTNNINNNIYFELDLKDKNIINIIKQINIELNINFIINKSYIDDNYGILVSNKNNKDQNIEYLFITHCENLKKFILKNEILKDNSNKFQMYQFLLLYFDKLFNI